MARDLAEYVRIAQKGSNFSARLPPDRASSAVGPSFSTRRNGSAPGSIRGRQASAQDAAPQPAPVTQTAPDAAPQPGFKNDQFASHRPSIGRRTFRTLARFFIAALIGVGATFAWHYHGDEAKEMVSTWAASLGWLSSVSTTKSRPDIDVAAKQTGSTRAGQVSGQDAARHPAPAAAAISLELVARDLALMRNSVEQLAAKQERMAHNIATLQAVEGDLALMRNSVEQLAAKQEQMTQNIATLQAAEQDIIQKMSSPPLSEPVPLPPRKPRVAPPKPAAQSSSAPRPAPLPQPPVR
jgi:hypothetical protein